MLQKHNILTILMIALMSTLLIFTACEKDDDSVTDEPINFNYGSVTDIEGNEYKTIQIGGQEWMAENLKTTTYNDGTAIDLVTDNTAWKNNTTGAYCWYDNDEAQNAHTYGALYNWQVVNTGNLCPDGWHVPTDEEWKTLEMHLGMSQAEADNTGGLRGYNEGSKLAGDAELWINGELENDSEFGTSGFTGLPGGRRYYRGEFNEIGEFGYWWSATEFDDNNALTRILYYNSSKVIRYHDYLNKVGGRSVRCLKD